MSFVPTTNYAEAIVETMREPLLVLDQTMHVQQANRAFYDTFEAEPDHTLGTHLFDLQDGQWCHADLRRVLEDILPHENTIQDLYLHQTDASGVTRTLLLNVRWITGADVSQPLILLLMEDVTERECNRRQLETLNRELESRVAARTQELEQVNKELEGFSYSVSHDLRAPLRSIDGFSRILLEDYAAALPEDAQRYLNRVRHNAQQMGTLVDELLAFSRMSRRALQRERVDPGPLVQDALHQARSEWPEHPGRVRIEALPACYADPNLLRQVFFNLLSNALKFSSKCESPHIVVGANESDPQWPIYYVSDNGCGFDSDYAHKLFTVFQRLHHEDEFPGTGVGLALVSRIVERHGGRVWAESEPNVATTFYIQTPAETVA